MGTRNLTAVFYEGEYRIAQYGQWDGYPSGQGVIALTFARDKMDREAFQKKLLALHELTAAETEHVNATPNWQKVFPHLSRDAGAEILALVQDGPNGMSVKRYINFAGESLFCEWAYVLDLDKNTFEAFRGFNHETLDPLERFASLPTDGDDYKQVKFVKAWPLDALPSDADFLAALEPPDEEEEDAA